MCLLLRERESEKEIDIYIIYIYIERALIYNFMRKCLVCNGHLDGKRERTRERENVLPPMEKLT